jgi:hypothetical protein
MLARAGGLDDRPARAFLRSDRAETKAALMLQFWRGPQNGEPAHFWASSQGGMKLGTEWKPVEIAFQVPARGERGFHEAMKTFRIRLDWPEKEGALFARDLELHETESMDEWQSWQALGGDRHSVIADPKFLAPEKDDYRLAPDSPAFALGFKPIPVEKIGPYQSDERASWPIVEAPGAREHPLK